MNSSPRSALALLLPAFAALLVAGCSAARPIDTEQLARRPLYDQRVALLEPLDTWSFEGRLAVSDAKDGGSGYLSWRQRRDASRMDFHGALGRGAWRLSADQNSAELEFADGSRYRAETIGVLVREQVGWRVPVEPLSWWIRGLAAPGRYVARVLDAEGRLSRLDQDGWKVEFERYGDVGGVSMPLKMTARQDQRTVKLAIRKWEFSGDWRP